MHPGKEVIPMGAAPAFASVSEAMDMVRAGLAFVAAADAAELSAEEQAETLRALERAHSVATAARTSMLGAFAAGKGYAADADYSPRAWLMHQTGITKGESVSYTAWVKRAARHPQLYAAMAAEQVSESYARTLCTWTDKLPADKRDDADSILADEAKAGLGLRDLAELAAEILARCRPDEPDRDSGRDFDDRSVKVQTTFQGAGVMHGDLTPECAAVVQSVLDALAAPAGAGDERTKEQRYHDALQEAMRRLVAGGLLPERAGQPVKALVHISLADLIRLPGSPALMQEWIAAMRARWAARRAAASETGSDGGAWLDGDAARAATCDASMTPVVTGDVDPGVLEELVRLCVHLDRLHRDGTTPTAQAPDAARVQDILEQEIIGKAIALVSGPGGLASHLRRRQLGTRLAGRSLPLDVGISTDIPAAIRRAVIERDQHCRFPNGCDQPAAGCEVHHLTHKADGGKTSVKDFILFCTHHHQVEIHRNGWTVVLNPDGTTTAWNRDRTKVLHSHIRNHSPPARPG
jgi:5-methylcytosine-specific restriction endonuclease McrA